MVTEITGHLVIVPALLLPYPLVNDLLANHLFSSHPETSGYLLWAVLSVDNKAVDRPLHLVRELDVMRAMLHPLLILSLGQLPSVHVFASSITIITFHLTAHDALLTPIISAMAFIVIGLCSITDPSYSIAIFEYHSTSLPPDKQQPSSSPYAQHHYQPDDSRTYLRHMKLSRPLVCRMYFPSPLSFPPFLPL